MSNCLSGFSITQSMCNDPFVGFRVWDFEIWFGDLEFRLSGLEPNLGVGGPILGGDSR